MGVYTRQSLYALLWGFNGLVLGVAAVKLDDAGEAAALLAGGLAVTAAGFAILLAMLRGGLPVPPVPRGRLALLLALSGGLSAIALTTWDGDIRGAVVTAVAVSLALPLGLVPDDRVSLGVVLAAGVLFALSGVATGNVVGGTLTAALFLVSSRASMWVLGIVSELDTARQAQAQLAVMEERLRFSRDVHDVLGRRLSTIAVQAELAGTLAVRGDEGAAELMQELRGGAHEALREARELARGYRVTDFAQELSGARSLLRSAGVEVRVAGETVPRAWQEAAGWIVRESVTNVLRHSAAGLVEIAYADGRLTVVNDGVRPGSPGEGSGLRGLRERLSPLGASLTAEPGLGERWIVVADLPGTGPLSATTRTNP